jgi:hypothetical protein
MQMQRKRNNKPTTGTSGVVLFIGILIIVALGILIASFIWTSYLQKSAYNNQNLIANIYSSQISFHGGSGIIFENCTTADSNTLCANQTANSKVFYFVCEITGNVYECVNNAWFFIDNFGGGIPGPSGPIGYTGQSSYLNLAMLIFF